MAKEIRRTMKFKRGRGCLVEQTSGNGRRTFKCKGLKRTPSDNEIMKFLGVSG